MRRTLQKRPPPPWCPADLSDKGSSSDLETSSGAPQDGGDGGNLHLWVRVVGESGAGREGPGGSPQQKVASRVPVLVVAAAGARP